MAEVGADERAQALVALLTERGLTLAVAETDTGGLIGSLITDVPGCSAVFLGGVTPYPNEAKARLLAIPRDLIAEHGSVSREVAIAMAAGIRRALHADIAVAETGVAGPTGGSDDRPVGTVWLACVGPDDHVIAERHVWDRDREGNKRLTAERALELIGEAAERAGA